MRFSRQRTRRHIEKIGAAARAIWLVADADSRIQRMVGGLVVVWVVLPALSGAVARGARGTRIAAYIFAMLMLFNAAGHTLGTIFGRTVASVTFPRPAPGFWSSPIMAAAAIYLLVELRRSRQGQPVAA